MLPAWDRRASQGRRQSLPLTWPRSKTQRGAWRRDRWTREGIVIRLNGPVRRFVWRRGTAAVRKWPCSQRRRPIEEMARRARPARSSPDPNVTSGRKVAPVKANNGEALGAAAAGVVCPLAATTAAVGLQLGLGTTVPAALVMQASTLAVGALKTVAP